MRQTETLEKKKENDEDAWFYAIWDKWLLFSRKSLGSRNIG
jgi:hypothetical protein